MMPQFVWIICRDNGDEGMSPPIMAFVDEAAASKTMELMAEGFATFKLFKVPVSPLQCSPAMALNAASQAC